MYACLSRLLIPAVFLSFAYGCSTASIRSDSPQISGTPKLSGAPTGLSASNITGVWHGRSFADCPVVTTTDPGRCHAMQLITLTMFESGGQITGSYRCSYGNENCRDEAETGVIRNGGMTKRLLRIAVMLEDGSMCRFTGMPQNGVLEGRYQCHWGGPMEQGGFRVERSY
jgi:hypothetical protein